MTKFSGFIGFAHTEKTSSGIFKEVIVEYPYHGDILRQVRGWKEGEKINDDVTLNNRYSIVADQFAFKNKQQMRYIKVDGDSWKITSFEIQRPRLILTVGGVYNG